MKTIAFTSITANYLPKARVLGHSLKRHASDVSFGIMLSEPLNRDLLRPDDPFDFVITIDQLGIDNLDSWVFKHSLVETCTAVKGRALLKLLGSEDDAAVLFFDPDIVITSSLDELISNFDAASVLLVPHGTEPETDLTAIIDNEISHLRFGVYNLGFLGVRNTAAGLKFARWWSDRLDQFCYDDREAGIFTDQRWGDLAPALFDGVRILRDPGYDVATWNLSHRVVKGTLNKGLTVNGRPLVFYHFSGFDSGAQEIMLDRYGKKSPILKRFRQWYIDECKKMGQDEIGSLAWAYSTFDNGQTITQSQRRLYRSRQDLQRAFPNPFATGHGESSFLEWSSGEATNSDDSPPVDQAYRIVVLALEDRPGQAEQLWQIINHSHNKQGITVVAPRALCDRLEIVAPRLNFVPLDDDTATPVGIEPWILGQIESAETDGVIFAQLGVETPDVWDLRLHWHALRERGAATVSPLYDGTELTSPFNGAASRRAGHDAQEIDRLISSLELRTPVDAPTFLRQCFYVSTENARTVLSTAEAYDPSPRPTDLARFSQLCGWAGFGHILANDVFVGAGAEASDNAISSRRADPVVADYLRRNVHHETRLRLADMLDRGGSDVPSIIQRAARRQLHVTHGWGGGLEHWVQSYCRNDGEHVNMILRPTSDNGAVGSGLRLYSDVDAESPIAAWTHASPIRATTPSHLSYRRLLMRIVEQYGIDAIIVSSLIGHSMDVLKTGLPTVYICHDYFPLTPEIYIRSWHLNGNRVTNFSIDEVFSRGSIELLPKTTRAEAMAASGAFRSILHDGAVTLVAPSASARQIYLDLAPELNPRDILVIPHGTSFDLRSAERVAYDPTNTERLRIVIPGRMSDEKGRVLLSSALPRLAEFADVLLLGCGLDGEHLADRPGIEVIQSYSRQDLPGILQQFRPNVSLLASDFAETFSYTLDEMFSLGIPPVAVRIGCFVDRIVDGLNGFLVDNAASAVVQALADLDRDRGRLSAVRATLERRWPRTETEMVRDYENLLQLPRLSSRAFRALAFPTSAYRRVSPGLGRSVLLMDVAQPEVRAGTPEFCRLQGSEILLHPPMPGDADTEIIFENVPAGGTLSLTASAVVQHPQAADVAVIATVTDSLSGRILGSSVVVASAMKPTNLSVWTDAGVERVNVTFASRIANGTTNDFAWLVISEPRLMVEA